MWALVESWSLASQPAGSTAANGAFGGQSVATVGGYSCWNQTSGWNYLWIPHPDPSASRMAIEVDVYVNTASAEFLVMPIVDGPFWIPSTFIRNGIGFDSTRAWSTISYSSTTLATYSALAASSVWVTVRQDVDLIEGTVTVYRDGVEVGSAGVDTAAAVGSNVLFSSFQPFSGSHCFQNLNFYTAP